AARRLPHAGAHRVRGVGGPRRRCDRARGGPRDDRAPGRRQTSHRGRAVNVLGLDSSTAASAACVVRADGEAFEIVPAVEELNAPPAHSRDLLPRAAEALDRAGLDYADLHAVAVGVGPGTFTGLRVGIAT